MSGAIRLGCCLSLISVLTFQSALANPPTTIPTDKSNASTAKPNVMPTTVRTSGAWTVVESANFRCWCQWDRMTEKDARQLAESCETWRQRLRTTWISEPDNADWSPKCDVYVHPHRAAYNQSLNRPGDLSVGSTIMNFDQQRTVFRRIDVRADAGDWSNAALPHELTHVVLGERFGGRALPRWADEGIAMLSESADKHHVRLVSLQEILTKQQTLSMAELVATARLPQPHLRDAFYGQSLALSSLLIRKSTPARFADFLEESLLVGFDQALQHHYDLRGVSSLQREWDDWTRRPAEVTFVSLPIQVGRESNVALSIER
jgi:Peptidase MA superfamily